MMDFELNSYFIISELEKMRKEIPDTSAFGCADVRYGISKAITRIKELQQQYIKGEKEI